MLRTTPLRRARAGWLAVVVLALALPSLGHAAAKQLWTLKTTSDIEFQRLTPLGTLLVATGEGLESIDPATGASQWKRTDLGKVREANFDIIPNTSFAILSSGGGMSGKSSLSVIDLATGADKWTTKDMPIATSYGALLLPHKNALFMPALTKKGKPTYITLDIDSGAAKWEVEKMFAKAPAMWPVKGSGGMVKRMSIEGCQDFVFDGNDAGVLWISEEGPVKIDLNTGAKLWTCAALKGIDPPATRDGYSPFLVNGDLVYMPFKKTLQAVSLKDGSLAWKTPKEYKSRIVQMAVTDAGLVIRGAPTPDDKGKLDGKPFIDLLDFASGQSKWKKPFKDLEDATTFAIQGDNLFIAADDEVHKVALADGIDHPVAKFKFRGNEVPNILEVHDNDFVLISSQNLMRIDPSGTTKWASYYSAPGSSMFAKIASTALIAAANAASAASAYNRAYTTGQDQKYTLITGNPVLSQRYKATKDSQGYRYILTNVEADGRKGAGLVRVNKDSGQKEGEVVLGDKKPEYELDEIEARLFYQKSDTEIIAFGF